MPVYIRLTIALLIIVSLSKTAVGQNRGILAKKVSAITANTPEEKLKKATLQWALDESAREEKAGNMADANVLLDDIEVSINSKMGIKHTAPKNLFPPVPKFSTNPLAKAAVTEMDKLIAIGIPADPNSPINNPKEVGDYNNKLGPQGLVLAEALCYPESPYSGDPKVIALMFHIFEVMFRNHMPGSKLLGNFGHSPVMTEMYLMVKTVYPDLILPSRKKNWELSLQANTKVIMDMNAKKFNECKPSSAYPNSDVKYITTLAFASILFDDPLYMQTAKAGERLVSTAIYPDGGWAYIGEQNENYTYHSIDISETCRYFQLTGDTVAKKNIEASKWYMPLSIEPPGVADYAMAPGWKHYWNQVKAPETAYMLGSLLNDPQNMRVAAMDAPKADFILASYYRDDITKAPTPDNYFVYDSNIQGPRGRFGTYSFSGTSRIMPTEDRGKSTYTGAMLLYPAGKLPKGVSTTYPLNVALDMAGTEVLLKPNGVSPVELSREEINATTVSRDVAAVTTTYRVAPYHGPETSFRGQQAWLYTPQRMVGLVEVTSLKEQDVYGVNGIISFLWSKPKNDEVRKYQALPNNTFKYGGFITQLHDHNYGSVAQAYATDRLSSATLKLLDAKSKDTSENKPIHYLQNETHYYLAEIRPETSAPATEVKKIETGTGLLAFEVIENAKYYRLIFNPTNQDITYISTIPAGIKQIQLHKSGEQYRPAWISKTGKDELINGATTINPINNKISLIVSAGKHIIITN
jgi:hypothetical protein